VAEEMQEPYPEILGSQEYISRVVMHEEENFSATLDVGLRILQEEIQLLKQKKCNTIPGDVVFKLYDTYGFPFDLTADIAVEQAMGVDEGGFQKAMESQQRRARQHWKGSGDSGVSDIHKKLAQEGVTTEFNGYDNTKIQSHVLKIIQDGKIVKKSSGNEALDIVTPETCFYGEAGGQAGDVGIMTNTDLEIVVSNTIKPLPELIVHKCRITNGTIHEGDTIELLVNADKRQSTANNHTATHILHYVLKQVLGDHVKQAGSLVAPVRLRFDFTHFEALQEQELGKIEEMVNERIREDVPLKTQLLPVKEAINRGAIALFGEKYAATVRVVSIGDYSMELCGGTHTRSTGEMGIFKITSEGAIGAGVRRIEATTGRAALHFINKEENTLKAICRILKTEPHAQDRTRRNS
jgi:alanyl-tRNA synthetase